MSANEAKFMALFWEVYRFYDIIFGPNLISLGFKLFFLLSLRLVSISLLIFYLDDVSMYSCKPMKTYFGSIQDILKDAQLAQLEDHGTLDLKILSSGHLLGAEIILKKKKNFF